MRVWREASHQQPLSLAASSRSVSPWRPRPAEPWWRSRASMERSSPSSSPGSLSEPASWHRRRCTLRGRVHRPRGSAAIAAGVSWVLPLIPGRMRAARDVPHTSDYRSGARIVQLHRQSAGACRSRRRVESADHQGIRTVRRSEERCVRLPDEGDDSPSHRGPVVGIVGTRREEPLFGECPSGVATADEGHHQDVPQRQALQDVSE